MQTFLPYSDFEQSAKVLDRARLGKQRVEVLQLLQAGDKGSGGWTNHPAYKMWLNYRPALALYGMFIIQEWINRGYNNNIDLAPWLTSPPVTPPWIGNEEFHASHRSNLIRKMPEHYSKFGWSEPNDLPYIWPT